MYPVDTIKTRMQALSHPGQRVRACAGWGQGQRVWWCSWAALMYAHQPLPLRLLVCTRMWQRSSLSLNYLPPPGACEGLLLLH